MRRCVQRCLDDIVAALFPSRCRACRRDLDGAATQRFRLSSGRLRRRLAGPWTAPLPLLCPGCAAALRRCRAPHAPPVVSAFEPGPQLFALVHAFKYGGIPELAEWFGAHLARVARLALRGRFVLLVPVPLHPERLRQRGFTQSLLLARVVGRWLGAPVHETLLVRHRATPALARLPHAVRHVHVQGAFARTAPLPAGAPLLLLVDDVVTSGATSTAALAALGAPPEQCAVLCLCRARDTVVAPLGTAPVLC